MKPQRAPDTKPAHDLSKHVAAEREPRVRLVNFARLNPNFVNKRQGFSRAVRKEEVTARDLKVMFSVLNEAQRITPRSLDPIVTFPTTHSFLRSLGLSVGGKDHIAVCDSLDRWEHVGFTFPEYYSPGKGIHGPKRKRLEINRVWKVRYSGSKIKITIGAAFWKANLSRKWFVKVELDKIRHMRTPEEILLYLLLLAFPKGFKRTPKTLFRTIGMQDWPTHDKPSKQRKRLERVINGIEEATGGRVLFGVLQTGTFSLRFIHSRMETN